MNTEFLEANKANWDDRVAIHAASGFYDLDGFRQGRSTLHEFEVDEIGSVEGLDLLHLQCHLGLDTLSWARLGARVVGLDFSSAAVAQAETLARELDIEARFICASVYAPPAELKGAFDIVYTSHGVLCWLPELRGWAASIASALRPGGRFYISEFHPCTDVFAFDTSENALRPERSYFDDVPHRYDHGGTYADADASIEHSVTFEWQHTLGDIVTELIRAGLRIEFLRERPFTLFRRFSFLDRRDGAYRAPAGIELPLMFSLGAVKDSP